MKSHLEIIQHPTSDTSLCVLLHYESNRYIFNCGEGTQRSLVENKTRIVGKVKNIFLSRVDWNAMGGLPGMLMTLADAGNKSITLHAGPNITHALSGMRNFMMRKDLAVSVDEFSRDMDVAQIFRDANLQVQCVRVLPEGYNYSLEDTKSTSVVGIKRLRNGTDASSSSNQSSQSSAQDHRRSVLNSMFAKDSIQKLDDEEVQIHHIDSLSAASGKLEIFGAKTGIVNLDQLPDTEPFPAAYSYICRGPVRVGKFLVDKAKSLGLYPGPSYARLINGESVTLQDGTVIHPHQCVGASRPGALCFIIDCPSQEYITGIVSSKAFQNIPKDELVCIVHNLGNGVLDDERYQNWMQTFESSTQHLISSSEHCPNSIIFKSSAENLTLLSKLDSKMFKRPLYSNEPEKSINIKLDKLQIAPVHTGMIYHLEPSRKMQSQQGPFFQHEKVDSFRDRSISEYLEVLQRIQATCTNSREDEKKPFDDLVHVTTLGTGSSIPSKYRNVSSTLVEINGSGSILLDCGEGTLGQLKRVFGPEIEEKLRQLKILYISHMHADHHLGSISVIKEWARVNAGNSSKLYLLAPHFMYQWLKEFAQVDDFELNRVEFIDNRSLHFIHRPNGCSDILPLLSTMNLLVIKTTDVIHCPWSFGVFFQHESGFSFLYSGDTRPCPQLVQLGQNCSLLIHEATLENNMQDEAVKKRHCTIGESIQVGLKMMAEKVILTHFSQRYSKIPVMSDMFIDGTACKNIFISFDMMRVSLGDLYKLPLYTVAFQALYKGHEDEDDEEKM